MGRSVGASASVGSWGNTVARRVAILGGPELKPL